MKLEEAINKVDFNYLFDENDEYSIDSTDPYSKTVDIKAASIEYLKNKFPEYKNDTHWKLKETNYFYEHSRAVYSLTNINAKALIELVD